ncbi:hypothetical protein WOLCODRAFT_159472 [Wolfiporia cocos MD-104 SS10]|uniref:Uncharacterized protein n=1 Tax=Wolfiporia cocos (strain MD-104) TaxID=742152 RepID=A0A2H3J3C2_WOLCO|nr:hypothetical protein WOLCODRAFT_159472 [Wolfiporia cocos MD-104 SS10]
MQDNTQAGSRLGTFSISQDRSKQLISEADHATLVCLNNCAYAKSFQEIARLNQEIAHLKNQVDAFGWVYASAP